MHQQGAAFIHALGHALGAIAQADPPSQQGVAGVEVGPEWGEAQQFEPFDRLDQRRGQSQQGLGRVDARPARPAACAVRSRQAAGD
jgi:hypothetical protein